MPNLAYWTRIPLKFLLTNLFLLLGTSCSTKHTNQTNQTSPTNDMGASILDDMRDHLTNQLILDGEELITHNASYSLFKGREYDLMAFAGAYQEGEHKRDAIEIKVKFDPDIQLNQSFDFSKHPTRYDARMSYIALSRLPSDKSVKYDSTQGSITFTYDPQTSTIEGTFNATLQNFEDSSDIFVRSGRFQYEITWKCFEKGPEGELIVLDADRNGWCVERRSMLK